MNGDKIFCITLIAIALMIGCITTAAIVDTVQDHEYRMAELSCNSICRNEFGHRVECNNE